MGNCLITTLPGAVDNDFLLRYDCVSITVYPHTENVSFMIDSPGTVLTLVGNAQILDRNLNPLGKEVTLGQTNTPFYISICESNCVLFISPKYGLNLISIRLNDNYLGFNINDFQYFADMSTFILSNGYTTDVYNNNIEGDIKYLEGYDYTIFLLLSNSIEGNINNLIESIQTKSNVERFAIGGENLECNIDDVDWSEFTAITTMFGISAPKATGTFSSFASMPSMTRMRPSLSMPLITGSVEDYVEIAKTRGAGSVRIDSIKTYLPNITYNGVALKDNGDISDTTRTMSWDASGNITWS